MPRYRSYRALISLVPVTLGLASAACASTEAAAASDSTVAETSETADGYKGGASAAPGVVDVSTAQQALTALAGNVDVTVDGFRSGIASGQALAAGGGNGAGAAQSVDVRCAGNGGANVDGRMNMAPAALDVNLTIAFSGCTTPGGTTVDGNIDFSQSLAASPDATTPFQVETTYVGDVNLSGNVNVSCPVDLNVLVDEHGRALSVQGMFCNRDASDLAMQLQPLWQTGSLAAN